MSPREISFNDPNVQRCPFPAYAEVRRQGPVYLDPQSGFYIVTGYDEILKTAADPGTFSSITGHLLVKESTPCQDQIDAIFREHGFPPVNMLVVTDPPIHTHHRALMDKVFTVARVRALEPYLGTIVDGLIDQFIDRGEVEFHEQLAIRVPIYVIGDQLGIPRKDFELFKVWIDAIVQQGDPNLTDARQLELARTLCEYQQYMARMAEEYRRSPADCILSDIVHADVNGRKLTSAEIASILTQILAAGSETTGNSITSAMYRIISRPGLEDELRANRALIPNFIEEVLRLESPVQGLYRRATRDAMIGDTAIPEGSTVILRFGAGNRDPKLFAAPDDMDIRRPNVRRHIAFGTGPHFCVGNVLARSELLIALGRLLDRMRNFRLTRGEDSVSFRSHYFVYGPDRLELSFDRI